MFEMFRKPKVSKLAIDQLYQAQVELLTAEHQLESVQAAVDVGRLRVARLQATVERIQDAPRPGD